MMMGFELIFLVALIVFAMKSGLADRLVDGRRTSRADDILDERFARGEITEEELRERKQALAPKSG